VGVRQEPIVTVRVAQNEHLAGETAALSEVYRSRQTTVFMPRAGYCQSLVATKYVVPHRVLEGGA